MDPEANVKEQRFLAGRLAMAMLSDSPPVLDELNRLSDLILAYYEWISKGGVAAQGYYPFDSRMVLTRAQEIATTVDKARNEGAAAKTLGSVTSRAQLYVFAAKILVATSAVGYSELVDGGSRTNVVFRPKNSPLSEGQG